MKYYLLAFILSFFLLQCEKPQNIHNTTAEIPKKVSKHSNGYTLIEYNLPHGIDYSVLKSYLEKPEPISSIIKKISDANMNDLFALDGENEPNGIPLQQHVNLEESLNAYYKERIHYYSFFDLKPFLPESKIELSEHSFLAYDPNTSKLYYYASELDQEKIRQLLQPILSYNSHVAPKILIAEVSILKSKERIELASLHESEISEVFRAYSYYDLSNDEDLKKMSMKYDVKPEVSYRIEYNIGETSPQAQNLYLGKSENFYYYSSLKMHTEDSFINFEAVDSFRYMPYIAKPSKKIEEISFRRVFKIAVPPDFHERLTGTSNSDDSDIFEEEQQPTQSDASKLISTEITTLHKLPIYSWGIDLVPILSKMGVKIPDDGYAIFCIQTSEVLFKVDLISADQIDRIFDGGYSGVPPNIHIRADLISIPLPKMQSPLSLYDFRKTDSLSKVDLLLRSGERARYDAKGSTIQVFELEANLGVGMYSRVLWADIEIKLANTPYIHNLSLNLESHKSSYIPLFKTKNSHSLTVLKLTPEIQNFDQ